MPNDKAHPANAVLAHTHSLVKDGLGAGAYSDLRSALGVSDQKLANSLSIPMRTLQRRLERGRFMPDESDRIARLSRIYQRAREVFESADSARTQSTAARSFGDQWVTDKRSVALRLPSAVIPSEFIYLLNPGSSRFQPRGPTGPESRCLSGSEVIALIHSRPRRVLKED